MKLFANSLSVAQVVTGAPTSPPMQTLAGHSFGLLVEPAALDLVANVQPVHCIGLPDSSDPAYRQRSKIAALDGVELVGRSGGRDVVGC